MKVLFIVQGEGRGHLTQAITMESMLRRNGHEVVGVLVGKSSSRQLPAFFSRGISAPVTQFESPQFMPTPTNKRNNLVRSIAYNVIKITSFAKSVWFLRKRIENGDVDLVINFYELLTGLTYFLFRPSVPQVSIGHQYLFLHKDFEFPCVDSTSLFLLRLFTRITSLGASERLALSFRNMADDDKAHIKVVPPLLRSAILKLKPVEGNYLHGYMVNSGFGKSIEKWHKQHKETPLHFFWDKKGVANISRIDDTLSFQQINDKAFMQSLAGCKAYATTAGFESVCEAMYLCKPILMVPAHIEQDCNAYDACKNGAGVIAEDFNLDRLLSFSHTYRPDTSFRHWADSCSYRLMLYLEKAAETEPQYPLSLSTLKSMIRI